MCFSIIKPLCEICFVLRAWSLVVLLWSVTCVGGKEISCVCFETFLLCRWFAPHLFCLRWVYCGVLVKDNFCVRDGNMAGLVSARNVIGRVFSYVRMILFSAIYPFLLYAIFLVLWLLGFYWYQRLAYLSPCICRDLMLFSFIIPLLR